MTNAATAVAVVTAGLFAVEELSAEDPSQSPELPTIPAVTLAVSAELEGPIAVKDGQIITIDHPVTLPHGYADRDSDGNLGIHSERYPNLTVQWSADGEHIVTFMTDYGLAKRIDFMSYEELDTYRPAAERGEELAQEVVLRGTLMHERLNYLVQQALATESE